MSRQCSQGVRVGHSDYSAFFANRRWLWLSKQGVPRARIVNGVCYLSYDELRAAGVGYESSRVHEDPCGDGSKAFCRASPVLSSFGPSKTSTRAVSGRNPWLCTGSKRIVGFVPSEQLWSSVLRHKGWREKLRQVALFTWLVFHPCEGNPPPTWLVPVRFVCVFRVNCMAIG